MYQNNYSSHNHKKRTTIICQNENGNISCCEID